MTSTPDAEDEELDEEVFDDNDLDDEDLDDEDLDDEDLDDEDLDDEIDDEHDEDDEGADETEDADDDGESDEDFDDDELDYDEIAAEDSQTNSDDDSDEDADDEEDEEEEFSLDQLSAAYAEVLKQRSGPDGTTKQDAEQEPEAEPVLPDPPEPEEATLEIQSQQEEAADLAACPVSPETILESVLFVGCPKDVKLNSRKIAALMRDVSPKEITALVKQLNQKYESENAAYRIVNTKGALKLELHPDLIHVQHRIRGGERTKQLSQQAIDVLAVIAYNQPIDRERVEKIRGIASGSVINQMVRRNLLNVETGGNRKKLFRTTDRFLDLFGLESLDDLPQTHDVSDLDELAD